MKSRWASFFLIGFLLAGVSKPLFAQDFSEEAKSCFERGQRYYDLKKYPEAIEEFERGYVLTGLPAFLLNIAQAYRLQGDLPRAEEYYKRFLERAEPDDSARKSTQKILADIESTLSPPDPVPKEVVPKETDSKTPVLPPPNKIVYDGGYSQDELKEMLGNRYPAYLSSGLRYEAYQAKRKASLVAWVGFSGGLASFLAIPVLTVALSSAENRNVNASTINSSLILVGTIGLTFGYYGVRGVQAANQQKRPPAAAQVTLLPGGGLLQFRTAF